MKSFNCINPVCVGVIIKFTSRRWEAECVWTGYTFHRRRFVDEEIAVPDDREIYGEISSLVPVIPVLQRNTDRHGVI